MAQPDPTEPLPMIPPALADDLRDLGAAPPVPGHVDHTVLDDARRHFDEARQRQRTRFRIQRFAAAAAGIALFTLVGTLVSRRMAIKPPPPRIAADFDGNGAVNILDAFGLARLIDAPRPPPGPPGTGDKGGAWDMNGDGKLDRADADAIAMRAVRLGGAS